MRIALMAVAATTMGGVALAAGTTARFGKPSEHRPTAASTTASIAASRPDGMARPSAGAGGSAAPQPSPAPAGLCRAYAAGARANQGKALDNPAFTSLILAAGGKDKVPAFCASALATQPGNGQGRPATPGPTAPRATTPLPTTAPRATTPLPTTPPADHPPADHPSPDHRPTQVEQTTQQTQTAPTRPPDSRP